MKRAQHCRVHTQTHTSFVVHCIHTRTQIFLLASITNNRSPTQPTETKMQTLWFTWNHTSEQRNGWKHKLTSPSEDCKRRSFLQDAVKSPTPALTSTPLGASRVRVRVGDSSLRSITHFNRTGSNRNCDSLQLQCTYSRQGGLTLHVTITTKTYIKPAKHYTYFS